jgi:hypothetical protein
MQLDEFNRTSSLVGALNGGVTSIERALLNIGSLAKNQAASSVQKIMASRIDKALAKLNNSPTTALSDQLKINQSLLISRKNGVNESIEVVSKSLAQINDIRNHIDYLRKRLTFLENGDLTAAETAEEWDNIIRRIQVSSRAAGGIIKEGNVLTPKNLINTEYRDTFKTQNIYAPYTNQVGDLHRIDGVYLGTDYYITEDVSGDFWNSDTNTLETDAQIGTLTEFSNYPNNTKTGQYETLATLRVNTYDDATGAINFTLGGYSQRMSDTEPNNDMANAQFMARQSFKTTPQAEIDAGNGNSDLGNQTLPWTSIAGFISNTATSTAATQDYDWFKFDLQAGEVLIFDVDYASGVESVALGGDDFDPWLDVYDHTGTNRVAFNDDSPSSQGGGGSGKTATGREYDSYIAYTAPTDGFYYVRMKAYDYTDHTDAGAGNYVINTSITPTPTSTFLGGGDIDGIVTGGGLALLDAWIYKNFESQSSIDQAKDALDAAEALVLNTEASFLHDRATLESRASIFGSQIDGMSKEIRDLIEDVEDEARAELLARQLEYTIAQFDFTLLAARSNTLIQSILISQDSSGYGKSTQENTARIGITLNQSQSLWG